MMATGKVPDEVPWGSLPKLAGDVTSKAGETYNVLTHSFTPASLKGIIFLTSPEMVAGDQASLFGEQMTALANGWKQRFSAPGNPRFIYTVPSKTLAPAVTRPKGIRGASTAITVDKWSEVETVLDAATP
jgi:hypothetical protein